MIVVFGERLKKLDASVKAGEGISKQEWQEFRAALDQLMLEYCPEEMSEEQMAVWARSQVPV